MIQVPIDPSKDRRMIARRGLDELLLLPEELFPQAHMVDMRVLEALVFRPEMISQTFQGSCLDFRQGRFWVDQLSALEDGNEDLFLFEMGRVGLIHMSEHGMEDLQGLAFGQDLIGKEEGVAPHEIVFIVEAHDFFNSGIGGFPRVIRDL